MDFIRVNLLGAGGSFISDSVMVCEDVRAEQGVAGYCRQPHRDMMNV